MTTLWVALAVAIVAGLAILIFLRSRRRTPIARPRTFKEVLAGRGAGRGVEWLLSKRSAGELAADHPARPLLGESIGIGGEPSITAGLLLLDRALETVASSAHASAPWTNTRVSRVWSQDLNEAGGALSEIEAFGTVLDVFPTCVPVPEAKTQTPDLEVPVTCLAKNWPV